MSQNNESVALQYKNAGNDCFGKNKFNEAVDWYSKAITLTPQNHILYSNRSAAYCELGKNSEALRDAERCISIDPQFVKGYVRKGDALYGLQRFEEANKAYRSGLDIDPTNESLRKKFQERSTNTGLVDPMEQHRRAMEAHNRVIQQQHPQNQAYTLPGGAYASSGVPAHTNQYYPSQQQQVQNSGGHYSSSSSSSSSGDGRSHSTVTKTGPDGTSQTLTIERDDGTGQTKKVVKRVIGGQAVEDVEVADGHTASRARTLHNMDPHDHYNFEQNWDARADQLNNGSTASAVSAHRDKNGVRMLGISTGGGGGGGSNSRGGGDGRSGGGRTNSNNNPGNTEVSVRPSEVVEPDD